jgi:hypothetical protein
MKGKAGMRKHMIDLKTEKFGVAFMAQIERITTHKKIMLLPIIRYSCGNTNLKA